MRHFWEIMLNFAMARTYVAKRMYVLCVRVRPINRRLLSKSSITGNLQWLACSSTTSASPWQRTSLLVNMLSVLSELCATSQPVVADDDSVQSGDWAPEGASSSSHACRVWIVKWCTPWSKWNPLLTYVDPANTHSKTPETGRHVNTSQRLWDSCIQFVHVFRFYLLNFYYVHCTLISK